MKQNYFSSEGGDSPSALNVETVFEQYLVTNQPRLVVDIAGKILASNASAQRLLGRTHEQIVGTVIGAWASDEPEVHLEILLNGPASAKRYRKVRASRDEVGFDNISIISLKEVGSGQSESFSSMLHNAVKEANSSLPICPKLLFDRTNHDTPVSPEIRAVIRQGLLYLAELGGDDPVRMELTGSFETPRWISIQIKMSFLSVISAETRTEWEYAPPFHLVSFLGGDIRIESSHPNIAMKIRLPK